MKRLFAVCLSLALMFLLAISGQSQGENLIPLRTDAVAWSNIESLELHLTTTCAIHITDDFFLLLAARQSAANWTEAVGIPIEIKVHSCDVFPGFLNGISEIYLGPVETMEDRFAEARATLPPSEQDIIIDLEKVWPTVTAWALDELEFLTAIFDHEIGHLLGLGDAYLVPGQEEDCEYSIMLSYCIGMKNQITSGDIEALAALNPKINDYVKSKAEQTPFSPLSQFDRNKNSSIDNFELFIAVDLWINLFIGNEVFFSVVDAWLFGTPVE